MNQNDYETNRSTPPQKQTKIKIFKFFIFTLITLFLISFSVTALVIAKSYNLTFVEANYAELQQQVGMLKAELSRKENEIEELKLQLANIEGESSFVNQTLN